MLLQFQDSESAFTSVVNLFMSYIINAVDPEMKSSFACYCNAFMSAMEEEVPDVASYFQENKISVDTILKDWMGSLFARTVSYEKSKRLWDILLLEGPFGIVKISLGILKHYSEKVTDMSATKLYSFLSHLPEKVDIDELAASVRFCSFIDVQIKSVNMAAVDWNIILQNAEDDGDASPEPESESEEEKPKKVESDSEDEKPAPKKVESSSSDSDSDKPAPKKAVSSSSDSSSSEDEKPAPKKPVSSSSDSSSSEDEKPAPKAAPKKESSSSDSSSSEDEKPAPKPAPKKESSSSDSSSSEDEKPAPKPAPKKDSSSDSSSSSDDEKPAPKPAPKKAVSSSSDSSSSD